jgi:hypothetical protein
MKIVWAVVHNDYDDYSTQSLHEDPRDAFVAAGYFTDDGLPKYGDTAAHDDVEAMVLYGPGETEGEDWDQRSEIQTDAYLSIYYVPALLRKQADGKRLTKHELKVLEEHG